MERQDRLAVEAQYLLLNELIGIDVTARAVAWADEQIRDSEVPAIELIELSLVPVQERRKVIWALDALSRPVRSSRPLADRLLARLSEELACQTLEVHTVMGMLCSFQHACSVLDEDERFQFSTASYELEFAETYGGDVSGVVERLARFMERYRTART
ncbi:hypothetical protein RKE25_11635 [Dyella sp. BiH032]|uniref:hypothetical protein n=1 Tax=Dyella sp. BiH032 TaxID=3075430 RepID=UPI00289365DF|nr:hypothetical protein [Dyella sp. BiH032]WNL44082.1 hypothetical protein RKE25_11635 [Dyella sp. BiH032]